MLPMIPEGGELEEDSPEPAVDEPYDLRPDLTALGIIEHERGVCEDTYENRSTLRRAKLNWQPVYDQSGVPTGMIAARSAEALRERRLLSIAEKVPLLVDPDNKNSDYTTGLALLLDDKALRITPPWVVGATRAWQAEQEAGGPPTARRQPKGLPHRCRMIKSDGIRCMLWASGRVKDDGLCRIHLGAIRKPGEDVERARRKIIQAAPYAVDVLEDLMENAESEPVRLKASTEILDRAGIRGGQDLNVEVEVSMSRPAAQVIAERLARLADGASSIAARVQALESADISDESDEDGEIVEAELVTSETDTEDTELDVSERRQESSPTFQNDFEDDELELEALNQTRAETRRP